MRENVDGDPPDGMEGREHEERLVSGEAEDGAALRDDDEGSLVQEVRVDIADGSAGKLQREFAISTRDVVTCRLLGEVGQCQQNGALANLVVVFTSKTLFISHFLKTKTNNLGRTKIQLELGPFN